MRTLYLAPERAQPLPLAVAALAVEPLLRELILHIVALGMLTPVRPDHDRMAGVLTDLLGLARREDLALPLPRDPRALALAGRLQGAPDRSDLTALAKTICASLRTQQRLFPRETGLTLEGWRQKARLIHSVAVLA